MSVIHLNAQNFEKEVYNSGVNIIIDFWAPWCQPCVMMAPIFEKVSELYKDKIKFAKLNTDDYPEVANQFAIHGIPTIVILSKGKELDRNIGFMSEPMLKQKIDKTIIN